MFVQSKLELFQIDRLARSFGIQKIAETQENLGARSEPDKKKVSPHNFLKERMFK